jgi:hypothetical protein
MALSSVPNHVPRLQGFATYLGLEVVAALPHTAKGGLDRRAVEDQYAH